MTFSENPEIVLMGAVIVFESFILIDFIFPYNLILGIFGGGIMGGFLA